MIFTDAIFPIFLTLVFAAHWLLPAKFKEARLMVLLGASAIFYGWWDVRFLALIGVVIAIAWGAGLYAGDKSLDEKQRNRATMLGVTANLLILGVFKYFNFFADSFIDLLNLVGVNANPSTLKIILPVGVSFYIFQAISFIVDVRREELAVETRIRRVALYIAFFPQLVAGPIVRAAGFFPQMEKDRKLSSEIMLSGLRFFAIGWVYKAGFADNIAPFVDPVFGNPMVAGDSDVSNWTNLSLVGATFAFGAQIYFDFAGYSMMAIGVARWFGFFIPRNFDFPYLSTSIADFWRRWHISLSSWLRDYLYISLGGNRAGKLRTYVNLFATMLLGGLWHGAAWTFVIWGALHGAALAVHRLLLGNKKYLIGGVLGAAIGLVLTQVFVIMVWAPFRAENMGDVLQVWAAFTGLRDSSEAVKSLEWIVWLAPLAVILDGILGKSGFTKLSRSTIMRHPALFWGACGVFMGCALAFFPLQAAPFVYFQF
ncbi:MBOAT family O-acyltransferase [Hirschia baltica]|uniref:Probable alginate O-acetylase AlgI n=1 Tax=Hirschia baltica (strain ATCC 49814 / DSM 5838 / IFAM 1418) TaxID=582402 RepID=C6XNG0_HIRBI|nr:MBOAT family O-acyltransferase [Hirschia baltica]ACT60104.1 membrane bound O-acyl transferase MBOAT family protein [Hirschia baltica ATCC 49814]